MAHATIQHPIAVKRAQPLVNSRGSDERGSHPRVDQPSGGRRQVIVEALPPEGGQRAEAQPEADQALPPECWYG
jgi:hypothetical protein